MSSTNSSQSPKKGTPPAVAQPDAPSASPPKPRRRPTQTDRTESSQQLKHERRQLKQQQQQRQERQEQEEQKREREREQQREQRQLKQQQQQRQQRQKQSSESTSTNTTPRKPLVRTDSKSTRPRRDSSVCNNVNCTTCGRDSRSQPSPLDSGVDVSGPSQRSPQGPPSPTASRQMPGAYPQERALVQPASSITRSRSTSRPRPSSWYGQFPPMMMGPNQHGPPPSMSAYSNMMRPGVQTAVQPFPGFYPPGVQAYYMQPSPVSPYEGPVRPALPTRVTDSAYATRPRPRSGNFGPPLISYEQSARPSARYPPAGQQRTTVSQFDDSSSEDSSSEEEEEEVYEQRPRAKTSSRDMPPPSSTTIVRRPSNRTENPFATRQAPEYRDRSRTITTTSSSRNSSNRRPSIASSGTKATSYSGNSSASAAQVMIVEPSYRSRRISYMGHEQRAELEAKRNSLYSTSYTEAPYVQAYYDERPVPSSRTSMDRERRGSIYENVPVAPMAPPMSTAATMATTTTERKRVNRQQAQAEDYMGSRGTSDRDPLNDYLRGVSVPNGDRREDARTKRASRVPSDSKSTTSRSSAGARTTVTRDTTTGAIKIVGIEQGQNINLQLAGNVDGGHTVQIRQNEDGTSELVIASASSPVAERESKDRERRYIPGSELRSMFGFGPSVAGSKLKKPKARDDGSVSGKSKSSSRKSDRDRERGRRKRRDDEYDDVHGA